MNITSRIARRVLAAAVLSAFCASAHAQQVGTASAVNPAATANTRTITIGASISHKEHIQTQAGGTVQLLFLDKTSMTIGPNSDLTIDEYVYDPNANTGKLAATLGKGALRFVGGQISHNGDAEIKTASATIGIRGGVMFTDGHGGIYAGYGTSTVNSNGRTVTLGAGEFTQTHSGDMPTPAGLPPPGFVAAQVRAFQSSLGQTGGVSRGAASQGNVSAAENRATGTRGGSIAGSFPPGAPPASVIGQINTIASSLNQSIQTSAQSAAVQTLADNARPAVTLTGYVGGLDIVPDRQSGATSAIAGSSTIILDPASNSVQASLLSFLFDPATAFSKLPGTTTALFQFGSQGSEIPANSTYADYENFGAVSPVGATVNGSSYVGEIATVSNAAARNLAASIGVSNLTVCQCDYTRWGFWAIQPSQTNGNNGGLVASETVIGTWVAGRPAQVSDVPTTGLATYIGHVFANVQNLNTQSVVAGNFTNTVDFGARSGAVSVTNLDKTNYAGSVSFQGDPRNFGGQLAGDAGGRSMVLQGSFFRSPTNPVGEMGGSVGLSGRDYIGSGIFAAAVKH